MFHREPSHEEEFIWSRVALTLLGVFMSFGFIFLIEAFGLFAIVGYIVYQPLVMGYLVWVWFHD